MTRFGKGGDGGIDERRVADCEVRLPSSKGAPQIVRRGHRAHVFRVGAATPFAR